MGGRITGAPQAKELARGKNLRQALERGAPPAFVPPVTSKTAAPTSSLSWAAEQKDSAALKNPKKLIPGESLGLRRQFLEQIFQSSPDPLIVIDDSSDIPGVNQEFQRMFGSSAAQALGQPIDGLIFPPDRAAERQWSMQCLQRTERLTFETQRRHKDGTLLDVSVSCAPLIIDGRTAAFYAIYRDISERKRAEALSSALYRIAEKASAAQDLQQFFTSIHSIVDELISRRNFSIAIHDQESELLSFPYFVDEQESAPPPGKLALRLVEHVLRTAEPLLCTPELAQQMQQRGEVELAVLPPPQWLGVPLKVNNHILGALVLKSYSQNVRFRERDKDVLTLISHQLAAAIDRKR